MWMFYVVLVAACSGSVLTFPQSGSPFGNFWTPDSQESFEADGFVFDGPTNGRATRTSTFATEATFTVPRTTTSTTTTTSTATTSTMTPVSAQMSECMTTCPVTAEFNPVCGSDNTLYNNPGLLKCAAFCGKDVTLRNYGPCTTTNARG